LCQRFSEAMVPMFSLRTLRLRASTGYARATLIEKHEICRKREAALAGERRGQEAAALDAAGAALGALGLLTFAAIFSWLVEAGVSAAFMSASLSWLIVSVAAWHSRRKWRSVRRAKNAGGSATSRCCRS
jgi:hypothetical protein